MEVIYHGRDPCDLLHADTLLSRTRIHTSDEALLEIYRKMRPGEPPTIEMARNLFNGLFFNANVMTFHPSAGETEQKAQA